MTQGKERQNSMYDFLLFAGFSCALAGLGLSLWTVWAEVRRWRRRKK